MTGGAGQESKDSVGVKQVAATVLVWRALSPQQKGGGCGNVEGEAGGEDPGLA
jgi:hypothetical protein